MLSSNLHLRLPRGLFTFTRRPPIGVIRVWPAHHSSLITLRITRNTPVMPFKVHKRTITRLESCDRISLGVWMCINGFFCEMPCEGPISQVSASTSSTEFAKICFILGIILDVHENITHYEPSLGPFLTSFLPVPSTFAQCYALRHPQHIPYSIAQLHS